MGRTPEHAPRRHGGNAESAVALFWFNIRSLSRAKGANAVAAAAYISREKLRDEQRQRTYDFRRRGGLVHAEILAPQRGSGQSQAAVPQRSALWNQAERSERRRNARVAREYQLTLPHELPAADRVALARRFAQDIANRYGSAVDLAVHNAPPGGDPRNVHAHLLATTREYHAEGLGKKTTIEMNGTARKARGLPPTWLEYKQLRAHWAQIANEALRERGFQPTMDSRPLKEQGITRQPQTHLGPAVTAIMRRGGHSYVADRIRAERLAILEQERASGRNQPFSSLDARRRKAVQSWRSYREQGHGGEEQTRRERDAQDLELEPARSRQRDYER
jgi:ATP-dependent exoDNAse (exonuclease V) alpha subunit